MAKQHDQAAIMAAAQEAVARFDAEQGFDFSSGAALYPTAIGLEQMGGLGGHGFDFSSGAALYPTAIGLEQMGAQGGRGFSTGAARYPTGMGLAGDPPADGGGPSKLWIGAALLVGAYIYRKQIKKLMA